MYSEESIAETLTAQAEVLANGVLGMWFSIWACDLRGWEAAFVRRMFSEIFHQNRFVLFRCLAIQFKLFVFIQMFLI